MSHGHFLRAVKEHGPWGTLKVLYKQRTLKFGQLIGTDRYGNEYYENRQDYAHGQHRWVIYPGNKNFYECDASNVPAEWHGWLHHVTEEPPTSRTTGSTHRVEPQKNAYGSSAPYARNLGGVIAAHTPNTSQVRPRAFGEGNNIGTCAGNEEAYYTQPGWPTDPRNGTRHVSTRRDRVRFTLTDTPLTLAAREAAKANLPLREYVAYTDEASPTRALLAAPGGPLTVEAAAQLTGALPASELAVLVQGAELVPRDPQALDYAVRLARGVGANKGDAGTFAAAVGDALTPAEEALLAEGADVDQLLNRAATLDATIASYAHIQARDAQAGVAAAKEKRDALLTKAAALRTVHAKLAKLQAHFDAKGYDMAREAAKELA